MELEAQLGCFVGLFLELDLEARSFSAEDPEAALGGDVAQETFEVPSRRIQSPGLLEGCP